MSNNENIDSMHPGYTFWKEKLNGARLVLAPMVDQSELPYRLLTKKYGSHLAYTPMLHAAVFARDPTYRAENFTTCAEDRPLIAQFCTDDPELFVKAGKYVEDHCDAIDLNLGCPQNIARRGHYGSFLQEEWDLIHKILSYGVANLKVPITAKIRVFDEIDKTVEYAKMVESTGVSLISVHGRRREQKGALTGLASWKHIKAVKEAVKVPVFANGNILCMDDVIECMKQTGCDGVMVAETCLYNPALFANLNPCMWDMAREYLEFVEKHPCPLAWIRGHFFKIYQKMCEKYHDFRDKIGTAKNIQELKELIEESKRLCESDIEKADPNSTEIAYWKCQAHIRHKELNPAEQEELKQSIQETLATIGTDPKAIKLHLDELKKSINYNNNSDDPNQVDQTTQQKIAKLLERKRRKQERIDRKQAYVNKMLNVPVASKKPRYIDCLGCKNPSGATCENTRCRGCCRDYVFQSGTKCDGHKFTSKPKLEDNLDTKCNNSESSNQTIVQN